ncbi:MAG: nucleotidyl transferase AbiEii/AbiGii toxin family protein [Blastocatellia bacterium]|nr:nucleotidyl transferase AbiEii/AbiGii toxin family protein [Blastocatellia bacterium]
MVKGLDLFRERFREFEGSFVLIGGAACHEWFAQQGAEFRATKDLDIVLIVEIVDPPFVAALRAFIAEGKYSIQEKSTGSPVLYRFAKPENSEFPFMLELFSRKPDGIELGDGQVIVPIAAGAEQHSLSAILLDNAYYSLIRNHTATQDGLPSATATALIPLKARAWSDLSQRKAAGEDIDSNNIAKHRSDVFRLAATLPGEPGPELPASIIADLTKFLAEFPENSPEWAAIQASLKYTVADGLKPAAFRSAIQTYFRA